jgi:hypothetical protein
MFSEQTNLPYFYVLFLFILHVNASITEKKAKTDMENIGHGGRTVIDISY